MWFVVGGVWFVVRGVCGVMCGECVGVVYGENVGVECGVYYVGYVSKFGVMWCRE